VVALADEKGAALWKADGMMNQGCASALTGLERNPNDHHGDDRMAVNGSDSAGTRSAHQIYRGPMPTSAISMALGAALVMR
jgi:hypothetical protein